ncbi:DUF4913 domain-containing protein [Streptomyces sp. NPDC088350]|uniref:DUF4913 domain-containing protein n=1 Tax=Streptomyces sp. NPDC088350 TaxID=3365854 RepID=UPI00381C79CE
MTSATSHDDDHQEPRFILYLQGAAYQTAIRHLAEWVHFALLPLYGKEETPSSPWCPLWWKHPEAVARLHGLFMAWHDLTSETYERSGPSSWHRDHLGTTMEELRDPRGTLAGCKAGRHQAKEAPLTEEYTTPPKSTADSTRRTTPEFIFYLEDDGYNAELQKLTSWVRYLIMPYYGRERSSDAPWCSRWWEHPEAVGRFHALWMAWDDLTGWDTDLTGPSVWHRDHLGPVLRALRHPAGPFAGCRPGYHRALAPPRVEPFPRDAPPPFTPAPTGYLPDGQGAFAQRHYPPPLRQ